MDGQNWDGRCQNGLRGHCILSLKNIKNHKRRKWTNLLADGNGQTSSKLTSTRKKTPQVARTLDCYTGGSRTTLNVIWSYVMAHNKCEISASGKLKEDAIIFQGEMYAIMQATRRAGMEEISQYLCLQDSQAAKQSTASILHLT